MAKEAKEMVEQGQVVVRQEQPLVAAMINKIVADKERAEAEKREQELRDSRRSERSMLQDYFKNYLAICSFYQTDWASFLASITGTNTHRHSAALLLVDPPYEKGFLTQSNRSSLAELIEHMVKPGGTVCVFFSVTAQLQGWLAVFDQPKVDDFVFEKLFYIHRSTQHLYRSSSCGHKKTTETVMILHRKDTLSPNREMKRGRKAPDVAQVEAVLGPAHAGSWRVDYISGACPPPPNW